MEKFITNPDHGDVIIITEKLDGSSTGVAKLDGKIIAVIRKGYLCEHSKHLQHRVFAQWVKKREVLFDKLLNEGEYVCGEWLIQAHGTIYILTNRSPFVVFDLFSNGKRIPYAHLREKCAYVGLTMVPILYWNTDPIPVNLAMEKLGEFGHYGAIEPAEGAVWRRENNGECYPVLAKYVRPVKEPGKYLEDQTKKLPIWNVALEDLL
jgi:ATP-dependent RNA circularization protein (DNA/RNA ligase family)